ncbi:hypothetical protein ACFQDZ_23335 [Sulfitobacter pacificus]|uniref:hypothetical protein n=1 Tax=Sulfitobacter pacificus TaxID=1499314 RepID=UPI00361D4CC3
MSYLIDKLPEVLFISHVNAVRLDGTPIPSREALINDVVDVVTQCGGRIYNPTHQMQKMTQEVAIEDYSDSLAHFTNEFSYVVVSDWFSLFLNDVFDEIAMQGDEALLDAKYVPHFEALLVNGALDGVEDRLLNIQAQQAGSAVLTEVLCKLYMSQNQLDKAFETAQAMRVSSGDSLELLWHYIDIAIEIGQFSHAADACKRLFDAEYDLTCERVKEFGLRAKAAQDDISALRFFDMALRLKPKNAEAAAELGQAILRAGDKSVWDALPEKLQIAVLSEFEANDLMGISKMVEFDFVEHLNLADMPADDLALYAANLAGEDRVSDAASMIAEWSRQKGGAAPSHADLRALVDEWFEKSVAAEDFETRMDLLDWVLLAQPMHAKARMAFRDIRRDVLKFAREMVAQSDRESLVGLAEQAKRLPFDLPELDLYLARLAFDKEDYEAAIAHGQSAAAHFNENVALWTMLMRSAFNLKDYIRADRFAAKVIETSDADTKRLEAEAEKRRDRMPILAYRAARQEEDVVKMIGLYAVAGRHDEYGEDAKRKRQTAETGIINQLRELQVQGSDEFVPFLQRVLQVMLTDPRVLISAGRYYVKQKDFATAQDYWRQLNEIDPSNEEISFQYNRCLERINEDQVA